ncbi:MAG: CopG family ribbon-helix-helix protein [Actinomycetota bacterium]|nr:ribbon-helix-helix protein, CopG family [Actinomycetota bacterium]
MVRKQVLLQLSDELLGRLDKVVAAGDGASRSAVVREAVTKYIVEKENEEKDRQWIEGYERMPLTEEELGELEMSARELFESTKDDEW